VYAALARLQDEGFVAETDDPGPAGDADPRRRYYRVTGAGVEAARAEAARLAGVLARARGKRLLEGRSGG
jgi:DNA-binding PadR family transcriptional regulator